MIVAPGTGLGSGLAPGLGLVLGLVIVLGGDCKRREYISTQPVSLEYVWRKVASKHRYGIYISSYFLVDIWDKGGLYLLQSSGIMVPVLEVHVCNSVDRGGGTCM